MTQREQTSPAMAAALTACRNNQPGAFDQLVTLLYPELRRIARSKLRRIRPGQTLDTTGLVHETYVKMIGVNDFSDQKHFLAASARAMRFILVDATRQRLASKRGSGQRAETLNEELIGQPDEQLVELISISEALERLRVRDGRLGDIVDCIFYAGLTHEETGTALGLSSRTVRRDWQRARAWLKHDLGRALSTNAELER